MFVVVGREHHLIVDVGVKWDAPGNGIVGWISIAACSLHMI